MEGIDMDIMNRYMKRYDWPSIMTYIYTYWEAEHRQ